MAHSTPKIIFGAASLGKMENPLDTLDILKKHAVKDLDTAYIYEGSEEYLKGIGAPKDFVIHTKAPSFFKGALGRKSILDGIDESLRRLGVNHVETYFLHAPDPTTPLEETCEAINEVYNAKKFTHFGLSNFKASDVQKIYDIQTKNGGPKPTVFQGNYNPVSRHIEQDLFPLLRKLGIMFYAYSPIAGGFLVKDAATLRAGASAGRWDAKKGELIGTMYNSMYAGKDSLMDSLEEWADIAKAEGISRADLAYRWIAYHSALKASDGIILGATKNVQLEQSLAAIEAGPLSSNAAKRIDEVWKKVEKDAPLDNYHSFAIEII